MPTHNPDAVFEFSTRADSLDAAASPLNHLVWAAPGTVDPAGLDRVWRLGPRGLKDSGGPFAAVLWDQESHEYCIATDPVGVMPVFWAKTRSGRIAVSTWLEALVDHAHLEATVDVEAALLIAGAHLHDPANAHRTPLTGVSLVPGGCLVRVRPDGTTVLSRYWDPSTLPEPDSSLSLAACAELLQERIDSAVRRLISPGHGVGAHISGGLDSTAVACRAQALLVGSGQRLVGGYSWSPTEEMVPRQPGDENVLLDDVEHTTGVSIRRRPGIGYAPWFRDADPVLYPESTHLMESWLLPIAQQDGVRVMLSGWGGDDFASYNGYGILASLVRGGSLAFARREIVERREVLAKPPLSRAATTRALLGAAYRSLPPEVQALRHPLRYRAFRQSENQLEQRLREASPLAARIRRQTVGDLLRPEDHHVRQLHMIGRGHLQHRTTWWHQTGQLFGIQYRYPLLDMGVLDAVARFPWWAFRYRGWDRPAFRLAVAPWVPDSVAWCVSKSEPANLNPVAVAWLRDNVKPRHRPVADAEYDRAMLLAWATWEAPAGQAPEDPPEAVVSRPDLAGRLREDHEAPWITRRGSAPQS